MLCVHEQGSCCSLHLRHLRVIGGLATRARQSTMLHWSLARAVNTVLCTCAQACSVVSPWTRHFDIQRTLQTQRKNTAPGLQRS